MARISSLSRGRTRITIYIDGLENPMSHYQGFRVYYDVHTPDKPFYNWKKFADFTSSSQHKSSPAILTPELQTWTTYAFKAEARFNGVWYDIKDGSTTIFRYATQNTGVYAKEINWGSDGIWLGIFQGLSRFNVLTYTEWNTFLRTLNSYRTNRGLPTSGLSAMAKGDVLTASYFRDVVRRVEEVTGVIFSTWSGMSQGDVVKGEFFIKMARALNKVDNPSHYDGNPGNRNIGGVV